MLNRILIISVVLKLTILALLTLINGGDIGGFHTNTVLSDDVRYITGALYYAQNAKSIIDVEVFTNAFAQIGDYTGYSSDFSLWYWFVCIVVYLFQSVFALRIINILFSALTAYYLYKLGSILFNEKAAKYAAIMYAFNPLFLVFPLYLYKDQLIALLIVQMFYCLYAYFKSNKKQYLLAIIAALVIFSTLRTGFVFILAAVVLALFFRREKGLRGSSSLFNYISAFFMFIISAYVMYFFYIYSFDVIQSKLLAYIVEREVSSSDTISMFQISSFSDFYKVPFAFIFALLQPINLTSQVSSVSSFIGTINIFGIFLATGNVLAFFDKKIRSLNFTWIVHILFLTTLITSLGIYRHYYFMLPFYVLILSGYIAKRNNFRKTLICSAPLALLIGGYYLTKII